jgi:hypothetical protein
VRFLLLLFAGCWQPAAVPVEPTPSNLVTIEAPNATTPSAIVSRKPSSPYADVAGTWKGIGFQYDTKGTWDIEMTLQRRGEIGDVIGTIAYEQGGCTANLLREPEEGDRGEILVMREKLVTGQGRCVDNGRIRIPRRPIANELDWRWDFAPGREGASSTVKRE